MRTIKTPVSYTHLDVYKRQAYNIRGGITTIAADLPEGQTYTPGQTAKVCVEMWDMNWTVRCV